MQRAVKVAALTGILLLAWSALFAQTFRYPFYWDDLHLIRPYTGTEIGSAFHALADPDKIETPGLRPCSILLFNFQGSTFGENIVAHHTFMVLLMGIFMIAAGMLLLEVGLSFVQLATAFILFVSSRVFASIVLWISLSHLLLAYICITLTAYCFILWTKKGRWFLFVLMLMSCTLATFTREETYTLPVVLPVLWLISSFDIGQWRRVAIAALSLFAIVSCHYALWHFLVPNALSPKFTLGAIKRFLGAMASAWLPGGSRWVGVTDKLIAVIWITFVAAVVICFLRYANRRMRWQFVGVCCLGAFLSLPALGVGRPFGIALPTIAFMTAVSITVWGIYGKVQTRPDLRQWQRYALLGTIILGLIIGIGSGIRRSFFVAESLRQNCAVTILRDGDFLFDLLDHPATIPEQRRKAGLARLEELGIGSTGDLHRLRRDLQKDPVTYQQNRETGNGIFLPKYDYLSF